MPSLYFSVRQIGTGNTDTAVEESMGKIHRKIVAAGVCCLMTGMLTGCGSDTTKITEGMQLVETLDYQGALNAFDEAEAQKEDSRLIARGRGIASMGLTEYDQAVEYFTQALELSDGWVQNVDYDMNYYLAAAYTKNGQPAEAKKVYDAILGLKPEEKDAYFLRGSAELELGDYESAKADFDQAISMDPKNYDRLIEIYEALAAHGYREVGQEYLQNVLDTAKQLDAYDSGRIYYYLGEYQKAYLALDEARDKGGADSYLYLGRAYAATGDYNYASSVYNNYLSKQGPNAEIYNELGLCEMAKKEYQNALAAFQAGKQIEGNSLMQTLCFNEIVAYEYLEDYQQAEVLMNAYLQQIHKIQQRSHVFRIKMLYHLYHIGYGGAGDTFLSQNFRIVTIRSPTQQIIDGYIEIFR